MSNWDSQDTLGIIVIVSALILLLFLITSITSYNIHYSSTEALSKYCEMTRGET